MKQKISTKRKLYIGTMRGLMYFSAVVSVSLVLAILIYVMVKGVPNITWELLSTKPSYLSNRIGILPDILNTLYIILATLLIVLPLGVGAAIYLTEYARNKKLVALIEYAAERFPAFRPSSTAWLACCCSPITSAPVFWRVR